MSESQARARVGVAVARQHQARATVRATPLRVVSGSGQGSQQRFWVTARGD